MKDAAVVLAVARIRTTLLHALGIAAILPACTERPIGESSADGGGSGGGSEATSIVTEGGTADDGGDGSSGGEASSGEGSTGEVLACEPDPEAWCEQVLCIAKDGATCPVGCGAACQATPEFAAVRDMCSVCLWEVNTVCGPAEQDGECCYVVDIVDVGCPGRPLRVAEEVWVAGAVARGDWAAAVRLAASTLASPLRAEAAARWTRAAQDEHASIAAFARSVLQLIGLGAPAALIEATQAALADEVEHARLAFAVAGALAGAPVGPGPLAAATAGLATGAAEVALATFHEGCVGETIAAAIAAVAAERCEDPALREVLRRIADDELRHAALAWRCLRWLLMQPGTTGVRAALAAVRTTEDRAGEVDEAAGPGCLSRGEERRIAGEVWRSVVDPCLRMLLRERTGAVRSDPRLTA